MLIFANIKNNRSMKVILDDLSIDEFFTYGGKVKTNKGDVIRDKEVFENNVKVTDDISECIISTYFYKYSFEDYSFYYINPKEALAEKDCFGIENVNFSLIEPDDCRWDEFKAQRLDRGFDDSELWNLDTTIINFILPRIKAFYDDGNVIGYPADLTEEEWNNILKEIINGLELYKASFTTKEDNEKIEKSLDLLRKHFSALWN